MLGSTGPRRIWRLGANTLCLRADIGPEDKIIDPIPARWIDEWVRNSAAANLLRSLLQQTSVASMVGATPRDALEATKRLREAILQAVNRREIVALRRESGISAQSGGGSPVNNQAPPSPRQVRNNALPPPPPKEEKTWVEFRLVNDDGKPMPGARYKLKVTDGSVREGNLDDNGSVRVQNLDPGMCTISFLDYDQREWKRK
jgi:hypothetical protein